MKTILIEKLTRITLNRRRLEELLNVKITNRGKEVTIEGGPENEYLAEKVIDALNFGFPFSTAVLIASNDFVFEVLNIKNYTKRKVMKTVRARIIGKGGKTLKILSDLTQCNFELKDNFIGVIGPAECMKNAEEAIRSITQGSKQANVYKFLEERQVREPIDLGLKK